MTVPKTGPELLPCPFCGSDALVEPTMMKNFAARCQRTGSGFESHCLIGGPIRTNQKDAAEAWNTRSLPAFDAVVKALEMLYQETADYITINKLGDVHHNQSMKLARAALALAKGRGKS